MSLLGRFAVVSVAGTILGWLLANQGSFLGVTQVTATLAVNSALATLGIELRAILSALG